MIGQFKQKPETFVLFHQCCCEIVTNKNATRVECESDLVSHYRKKLNFLGSIDIRSLMPKVSVPTLLWLSLEGECTDSGRPYFFKISWSLENRASRVRAK